MACGDLKEALYANVRIASQPIGHKQHDGLENTAHPEECHRAFNTLRLTAPPSCVPLRKPSRVARLFPFRRSPIQPAWKARSRTCSLASCSRNAASRCLSTASRSSSATHCSTRHSISSLSVRLRRRPPAGACGECCREDGRCSSAASLSSDPGRRHCPGFPRPLSTAHSPKF
jgi:hypothetical protein